MRTVFLFLVLIVLATGAVMAGGNMSNKLPAMAISALCVLGMFLLARPFKAH